ncbi:DUF3971 domain-containing protein [Pseudoruegeria sp. SHC-113]|uniref:YhdP family protein n=1 Tax=Pseudoruegeria sp. SHC-113 TaxID=2855439 RepID=UPI0021BA6C89|nr:AsmA-like C-terminal region-containing protein [Pseudoruegeria sp. SHC-113]MCT8160311.1 hypothetical protein [Pseudoruegeria sp. SHC-113]
MAHVTGRAGMTETDGQTRRSRRRGLVLSLLGGCVLLLAGAVILITVLASSHQALTAPGWLKSRIEARINGVTERIDLGFEGVGVLINARGEPTALLREVTLRDTAGTEIAQVGRIALSIAPRAALSGSVVPTGLVIEDTRLLLQRGADGRFNLDFGAPGGQALVFDDLPGMVDALEALLDTQGLARVERAEAKGISLRFEDALRGVISEADAGRVALNRGAEGLEAEASLKLPGYGGAQADLALTARTKSDSAEAAFTLALSNVDARFLAAHEPIAAFLTGVDAPVSLTAAIGFTPEGAFTDLSGTLEIGAGKLQPNPATAPVSLQAARAELRYDFARAMFAVEALQLRSDALKASGAGKAYLKDWENGVPKALVAQLALTGVESPGGDLFAEPLAFADASVDLHFRFSPFLIRVGQATLFDGETRLQAKGRAEAKADGWHVALDAQADRLSTDALVRYWPLSLRAKTRNWMVNNLRGGTGFNGRVALRLAPGTDPVASLAFEYEGAEVNFLPNYPPISAARGYGQIDGPSFAIHITEGEVREGARVADVSGSSFRIRDMRIRPSIGQVDLKAEADLGDLLHLLDLRPLRLISRAGRQPDLAEGLAHAEAQLVLPLSKETRGPDVDFTVTGQIEEVRSEALVPGRVLSAPVMDVAVDADSIRIGGAGDLDGVGFNALWRQPLGAAFKEGSSVTGVLDLSPQLAESFRIGLPPEAFSGKAQGRMEIALRPEEPPSFALEADLAGLGLNIAALGWRKAPGADGQLRMEGAFSTPPAIDLIALDAAGLSLSGNVALRPDGSLSRAVFDELSLGNWLKTRAELRGRDQGQTPALSLTGSLLDLRRAALPEGSGNGGGAPVNVAMDRLQIAGDIYLSAFRGQFGAGEGAGRFTGRLNGVAPVTGQQITTPAGVGYDLVAADGGAVLAALGVLKNANSDGLEIRLRSRAQAGHYDGTLRMGKLRLRGAPALAEMLGAVSVVGLLDQLNGNGIVFDEVEGEFVLTPERLVITRGSAVGASMGISIDGTYAFAEKQMDFQGVVSPVYLVNSVGAALTRRGEGLFGFSYRLIGPVSAPRTQVNPLSLLTPGMFRDIFRRPPPEVSE